MTHYYNDIDPYCCKVLRKNITNDNLPEGSVDERDIRNLHATNFVGYEHVSLFAGIGGIPLGLARSGLYAVPGLRTLDGGFPCQNISNAGKREGITGEQSGLWKEMYRLICESLDCGRGFDFIILENVASLVNRGLDTVLIDLAKAGLDAQWTTLRACDFGAPHIRERIFLVAYLPLVGSDAWRAAEARQQGTPDAISTGTATLAYLNLIGIPQPESALTNRQCCALESAGVCGWEDRAEMAHATSTRLPIRGYTGLETLNTQETRGMDAQPERCGNMADTGSTGQQECHAPTLSGEQRHTARQPQPLFCGGADGLSGWLDGYRWPVGPGVAQEAWEPPRITEERMPHRVARLKALGNAVVPQVAEYVGRCILAALSAEAEAVS